MYAVVQYNNYDYDCGVHVFETLEKAQEFMKKEYERFLEIERVESGVLLNEEWSHLEDYHGHISYENDDIVVWSITEVKND